ncbi:MAG: hypothetical protein ACOYMR_16290 [Ilumatobacteraceae bacterium]
MSRFSTAAIAAALLLAACSGSDSSSPTTGGTDTTATTAAETTAPETTAAPPQEADAATLAAVQKAVDGAPAGCDPLDTARCLLPFPSNVFTTDDSTTPTGRRISFPADGMPKNTDGVSVDATEWNRNDGFSPNTPLLTFVPGLDADQSKLPTWTDIGASLADDFPIVLVDLATNERVALWSELDSHPEAGSDRLLTIRPAVSLPEGHTFAVGLRGLKDSAGADIPTGDVFRVYRDNLTTGIDSIEARRPAMEEAFTALAAGGAPREPLQLAWSFTVASTDSVSGRMLSIRDQALEQLGNVAPKFTITTVTPNSDDDIALQIDGTFTVPNFLTGDGGPGNRFFYAAANGDDPDALPSINPDNPTLEAPFVCNISVATMNGTEPAHLVEYGHGLLGAHHEIDAGNVRAMSNEHNVVHCATKWAGMSEDDIGNAAATLVEFGNFPTMADRLQQGVLNQIFLGRLMTREGGLASDKNFQRADGTPLIDTSHLDYDGNSQGGIMGAMLAALSPDIERAVLGVTGMNYSMLLPRSVDFDDYLAVMEPAYPDDFERPLIFAIVQMLWDRGEGAGYVQHLTADPYEGTPAKTVLMHVAYGDHQVTQLSAMVEARTIGATIHRPVAADGRWAEQEPGWNLESTTYPSTGSAIVVWDSGMAPIPFENLPPREGDDSHEDPRADPDVRVQKASFLFEDTLIDVCDAKPCTADHRE